MASSDSKTARWFASEVEPHDAHLKAYVRGTFPTVRDVEDVVQESYLRVWKAQATGSVACARGFLFRVARNIALDLLRRERRSPTDPLGDVAAMRVVDNRPGGAETAESRDQFALLDEALEALSPRHRQVVILCKLQSKSHREVASLLGISEKTVTEHVYRAVQRLGEELQRRGVHHFRP